MNFAEGKKQFIQTWGKLGSEWGINRTMAQVHALLLIAPKPLSTEEIMEELSISRGNANMNIRDLISWNLVHKELVPGDRKEYFLAEKDIWEIAKRISRERKRREIEPVKNVLHQLQEVEGDRSNEDVKAFTDMMNQLGGFVDKMDKSVDIMLSSDQSWFFGMLLKLIK
ncbi:MAG: transcriptional regulator [Sporocytophaga sp.]|uniref:GbsR/MarR family transcriptional regulator n=1 Tax=Sporocytophaga sp. TaxID=2231183 RepID=UPI001B2487C5|nr:MarR family transcriptional regulator [Sporocytophaga sp.]MBO9702648.1 transcriptional regulator [Sporocytophaga sp.]